jgi:hypothetical protein
MSGLAVVGLTGHEVSLERAARSSAKDATCEPGGRLAAAPYPASQLRQRATVWPSPVAAVLPHC